MVSCVHCLKAPIMALFSPLPRTGLLAPCLDAHGPITTLTQLRQMPLTQDATGEVVLTYTVIGTLTGRLEPQTGSVPRFVPGINVQVAYLFLLDGQADVRELDRFIGGRLRTAVTELIAVPDWGTYLDIPLRTVR